MGEVLLMSTEDQLCEILGGQPPTNAEGKEEEQYEGKH